MKYVVKSDALSLRGDCVLKGRELSEEELEGIDIDRLIGLGAIAVAEGESAAAASVEEEKSEQAEDSNPLPEYVEKTFDEMTKAELAAYGLTIGLQLDPKKLNKSQIIAEIEAALDSEEPGAEELPQE
jgi:hypothetical protein